VPLKVGERVVAVMYADDVGAGERMVPAPWPEALELLARHAARCLEVITARRAGGQEAVPDTAGSSARMPAGNGDQHLLGY
jgi:hypothetical protein